MPDPVVTPTVTPAPVVFSKENPPKSKEDWNKLSTQDPQLFISLTQENTDRIVRESRELREQLDRERQEKQNLNLELTRYKQPPIQTPDTGKVIYGPNNFPKTTAEWDALAIENPTYAMDLRYLYNNRIVSNQTDFNRAFSTAAQEVQGEHPDMYLLEVDESGQPKKDEQGKLVLRRNAQGLPIFNDNSEKGKLWNQIYQDSYRPDGTNPLDSAPNAPKLMMAELERRLRMKGQAVIQQTQENNRQNHVVGQGVPPPVPNVKVKFATEDERLHVEKAIQRGVYQNAEEYCQLRDSGQKGFYEQNSRPDFSRK